MANGRPTVDELYRVLEAQAARIAELEASLHGVLGAAGPRGGGSGLSRAVFLKTAAAALAGGSVFKRGKGRLRGVRVAAPS